MTTSIIDPMERLERVLGGKPIGDPDRHERVAALARERSASTPMRHKLIDIETTERVTGEFTAKISDWEVDRQGERFAPTAFDNAIRKLKKDGRPIPVLFGHDQQSMAAVLGHVMPDGLHVTSDGLYAEGWVDTSTDVGRKLHEMLRRNVLRWSVGFSLKRSHKERDVVVLDEVNELLALSAVPVPANARTSTLAAKSARVPTLEELRKRVRALGLEGPEVTRHRSEFSSCLLELLTADAKSLPSKPERTRRSMPITIKSYRID